MSQALLDAYFYRREKRPSLGLAVFNASPALPAALLTRCRSKGLAAQLVTLSKRDLAQRPIPDRPPFFIIYQDLPPDHFDAQVQPLVEQFLYPAWFRGRPFAFLSAHDRAAYERKTVDPAAVHSDPDAVLAFLLREQLLALLDWSALQFAHPHAVPDPPAPPASRLSDPPQYPIEADLDPEQTQALEAIDGPVRVLAPAGSGKTKTLTNRIVRLLNGGVPGEQILALAFNKKAAEEMTARLAHRGIRQVEIRTFHALGYRIIRETLGWRFAGQNEYKVMRRLLKTAVAGQISRLPSRRDSDALEPFAEALRRAKTELPPLEQTAVVVEATGEDETRAIPFEPIFQAYLRLQSRQKFLTFNDMVYLAVRLLLKDDDLRRRYQDRYQYLLIDEFQDLNRAQLLMMQILALPHNNLFVVGDDDQMIYGWRGAQVGHILDFPRRFPIAQQTVLATNYRSGRLIVEHSRRLIGHNVKRVDKDIRPRPGALPGSVSVARLEELRAQARATADWIAETAAGDARPWSDFAILFRYRAYQVPLALALDANDIPHTPVDLRLLFRTAVGRDLHAYLNLIRRPDDAPAEAWRRALLRPNRYLTNQVIRMIDSPAALQRAAMNESLPDWLLDRLADFAIGLRNLQAAASAGPAELLHQLDAEMGLMAYYSGLAAASDEADRENDAILFETIFAVAAYFDSVEALFQAIEEALTVVDDPPPPPSRPESLEGSDEDEVTLSTIHRAKGKEWPAVVYFNLSQGAHSVDVDEIEEERRVAYVAVTRAQERLLITADQERPSPFLRELLSDAAFSHLSVTQLVQRKERAARELAGLQKRQRQRPSAARADQIAETQRRLDSLKDEINARR